MKPKVFRWCVLFWAIFVGNVALCHAFSFGEIRLLSQFGGPFLAEVELSHEVGGVVEIEIGSRKDYRRLQFERPAILDELEIVEIRRLTANSVLAQIASRSALFYPSFHLILKASHNGGTLLESYLIAVDFQSSLSLGGSSSENDLSLEKPDQKESAAVLSTKGIGEENNIPVPVLSAEVSAMEGKIAKEPTPLKHDVSVGKPLRIVELEAPGSFDAYTVITSQKPASLMTREFPTQLTATKGISPKLPPGQLTSLPEKIREPVKSTQPVSTKKLPLGNLKKTDDLKVWTVRRGENLSIIAKKIDQNSGIKRVAVALWMANRDSFIFGNMSGLKVHSTLRTDNLEELLRNISEEEASLVFENQLIEWKSLKDAEHSFRALDIKPSPAFIFEHLSLTQSFSVLKEWHSTWERADWEGHWELFSKRTSSGTKQYKEAVFHRYKDVHLSIGNAYLTLLPNGPGVFFDQEFSSTSLRSIGEKEIHFVDEEGAWKVHDELFSLGKSFRNKDGAEKKKKFSVQEDGVSGIPYVIYISSHKNWEDALDAWQNLKKAGIETYISPYYFSEDKKVFRLFIGRFKDSDAAERQVGILKQRGVNASPWDLPYSLKVGTYSREEEAMRQSSELLAKGFSSSLLAKSKEGFDSIEFQVILGAFAEKESAEKMGLELLKLEINYEVIQP
jgi:hypothetical protein